jgi:hypothetical protein
MRANRLTPQIRCESPAIPYLLSQSPIFDLRSPASFAGSLNRKLESKEFGSSDFEPHIADKGPETKDQAVNSEHQTQTPPVQSSKFNVQGSKFRNN